MAASRRLGNLAVDKTVFFLCDMQERFRPAIHCFKEITLVAGRLVQATKILDIPLIVTEQYPKGLGNTVSELDISHAAGKFEKTKFSMIIPDVEDKLRTLCDGDVQHVVLFGIEAHVCVQQTVIDLLSRDRPIEVHVVADACSSRSQMDRLFAYETEKSYRQFLSRLQQILENKQLLPNRFRHAGATVTTSEAVLLQCVGDKNHPKFKEIQGLIKESAPDSGLTKL